jgi:hypothetical protein
VATLRLKTENPTHDHPSMIDSMCWAKFGDAGGLPGDAAALAYGSDEGYRK